MHAVAALTHTQQYMIALILLFIIQFSISVASLAVSGPDQQNLINNAWCGLSNVDKVTMALRV